MKRNLSKKILKLIFILIIIVILLLIIFIKIKMDNNNASEELKYEYAKIDLNRKIEAVFVDSEYSTVKKCINKYYDIKNNFNELEQYQNIKEQLIEEYSNNLLAILDKEYINDNNLKIDDIRSENAEYSYTNFLVHDMYVYDGNNGRSIYFVYGKEIDYLKNKNKEYGYIVKLDKSNNSYSLYPYDYMKKYNYIDKDNILRININMESIEKNKYNHFDYYFQTKEEVIEEIFSEYKLNLKFDLKYSYDLLDSTYKDKKFKNYENYERYLNLNKENILKANILKYEVNNSENYKEYLCLDQFGNYYVFKQMSNYKYTVMLDIYTVDINEFIDKYNKSSDTTKVALNLEKFKQMLNRKDYDIAYKVLDETFRNNNFGNVNKFKDYVQKNWFDCNKFNYQGVNNAGNVFTINVQISDNINNEINPIDKTFIVKLKDETNFVMSFEV